MFRLLNIGSNEFRYVLLFITSITLGIWQYFGMSLKLAVFPNQGVTSASNFSDFINGGQSKAEVKNLPDRIDLHCRIVLSDTFAFCGVSIPLTSREKQGVDLNRYTEMELELDYSSPEKDTLLIYLNNKESLADGKQLEKSNLWVVSPVAGNNRFSLQPQRFFIPSWWIFKNQRDGLNLEPDIHNVVSISLTTGDNTVARTVDISIKRIIFYGKWVSAEQLYFGLLLAWLTLLSMHGLIFFRKLSISYKQSRQHNKYLVKLNQFLSAQKDEFETLAKKDKLTGAWNRAGVRDLLKSVMEQFLDKKTPCSLLVLDIDHFKQVNDDFGHDVGDEALKSFVSLIESNTRDTDVLARWGGEEFILICPATNISAAEILANTISNKLANAQIIEQRQITCSIGIAQLANEDIEEWFKRADKALYEAKQAGRNCVKSA